MDIQISNFRQMLRKQRNNLNFFQQRTFENQILHRVHHFVNFQKAKKIGLYLDAFGEIRTQKLIEQCFALNKKVYLPMICNMNRRLVWVEITKAQYRTRRFNLHSLGMLEPMASRGMHVSHLDLLILPLLACDHLGTRMGMGGGFYDRTLATATHSPYRLGLGHNFQYLNVQLKRQAWDQPLDCLITPNRIYKFKRNQI